MKTVLKENLFIFAPCLAVILIVWEFALLDKSGRWYFPLAGTLAICTFFGVYMLTSYLDHKYFDRGVSDD